jgi:hypothetical protein
MLHEIAPRGRLRRSPGASWKGCRHGMEPDRRGWGRIRRLPSRKYQAAYVGPDARLHQAPATFSAHIDAEGWLATERRLIELGDWTAPAARHLARYANTITVAEFVAQWIAERELARWTRISYESTLRTAIAGSVIAPIAVKS